ncbi:hypothetical protein [Escherichia coli]|uniref:hypothetical protein n=1 Tax=Escherichia coli TaxID=562 RepID=UPI001E4A0D39|nr:hypothetical protein [Escherichia coli]
MQDNIDCESGIIFDNDEDKTDSAALLPCIEQAREQGWRFHLSAKRKNDYVRYHNLPS